MLLLLQLGYGIYFLTYEYLMQRKMRQLACDRSKVPVSNQVLYGAASGYTLWMMIFPIDVIKSKIQTVLCITVCNHRMDLPKRRDCILA